MIKNLFIIFKNYKKSPATWERDVFKMNENTTAKFSLFRYVIREWIVFKINKTDYGILQVGLCFLYLSWLLVSYCISHCHETSIAH